jgi:signal transduction histidine kinase
MIPRSIRWRLPLSYAGIALLVALALGGILLVVLRGYYTQREIDHLTNNARAISNTLMPLLSQPDVDREELQARVESLSFLTQTRVRILDADRQVLADSGPFDAFSIRIALAPRFEPFDSATGPVEDEGLPPDDSGLPAETEEPPESIAIVVPRILEGSVLPGRLGPLPAGSQRVINDVLPVVGTLQGFDLSGRADAASGRSDQRVRVAVYPEPDQLKAIIVLSEGPAYGSEIVGKVAWGWAIAAVLSVILAAGAGWFISRRINAPLLNLTAATARMAAGDLSARAGVAGEDEFGALARSFNQMAEQVQTTVVTLRRFVSDAAHELNTPLTALQTNLELAPDQEFVRRAQAQVGQLARLTEGLLDLSRLEAASSRERRASLELVALVREASELYASRADQGGLAFTLSLPPGPVTIQGDRAQLRQVLENLLDNAIKFTPEGGSVAVGIDEHQEQAELWVEDTGIGIPADDLPGLFGRFHRGRNAGGYPGSGLGLAIARAIVENHGGHIQAESLLGEGTRVSFTLPTTLQRTGASKHDGEVASGPAG